MLNLTALQTQAGPQVTGTLELLDISGAAFSMTENGRTNAGISFSYEGGKFSAPIEPIIAEQLQVAANRETIRFSRVVLRVSPASFGREKRGGFRATAVLQLESQGSVIFSAQEEPAKAKKSA